MPENPGRTEVLFQQFRRQTSVRPQLLVKIVISNHQGSARQGVIAAVSVTLFVAILALGFKMHWAHCYALATAYAIGMAKAFEGTTT